MSETHDGGLALVKESFCWLWMEHDVVRFVGWCKKWSGK